MSDTTQVQVAKFWTDDDVADLMAELSSALDKMEPYYAQCNAGDSGYALLSRLEAKQDEIGPFFAHVIQPTSCAICKKTFEKSSRKNKLLSKDQQWNAALSHMLHAHEITDHADKKANVVPYATVLREFKNRKEYLEGVNVLFQPASLYNN